MEVMAGEVDGLKLGIGHFRTAATLSESFFDSAKPANVKQLSA
jgi:hypothetical protein